MTARPACVKDNRWQLGLSCRLVVHCLLQLCRCQAKGIVEHAVLVGTPVSRTPEQWRNSTRHVLLDN